MSQGLLYRDALDRVKGQHAAQQVQSWREGRRERRVLLKRSLTGILIPM
jgi:hypothetical protein